MRVHCAYTCKLSLSFSLTARKVDGRKYMCRNKGCIFFEQVFLKESEESFSTKVNSFRENNAEKKWCMFSSVASPKPPPSHLISQKMSSESVKISFLKKKNRMKIPLT